MPTVGVFFGGRSSESEVSVITGLLACNLLRSGRDRVVPVYLPPEGGMVTGRLRAVEDVLARKKLVRVRLAGKTLVREGSGRAAARPGTTHSSSKVSLHHSRRFLRGS